MKSKLGLLSLGAFLLFVFLSPLITLCVHTSEKSVHLESLHLGSSTEEFHINDEPSSSKKPTLSLPLLFISFLRFINFVQLPARKARRSFYKKEKNKVLMRLLI
ncbi:MAG: hypothetical protein GXO04_00870 [Aquificae bacterium]|nr:hypothetical protein [Aquificota bacterium]